MMEAEWMEKSRGRLSASSVMRRTFSGSAVDVEKAMKTGIEGPVVIAGQAPAGVFAGHAITEDLHGFTADGVSFLPLKIGFGGGLEYRLEHAAEFSPGSRAVFASKLVLALSAGLSVYIQSLPAFGVVVETQSSAMESRCFHFPRPEGSIERSVTSTQMKFGSELE